MTIPAAKSRPKSAAASTKSKSTGKTTANSTMDCPSSREVGSRRQYRNLLLLWHQRSRRRREQIVPVTSQETLLRGESAVSPGTAPWANREGPAERMRLARPACREGPPPARQGPDRRHLCPERLSVEPTPLEGGGRAPHFQRQKLEPSTEARRQRQYAHYPRRGRRQFPAWKRGSVVVAGARRWLGLAQRVDTPQREAIEGSALQRVGAIPVSDRGGVHRVA
jgi:hypothetical protein